MAKKSFDFSKLGETSWGRSQREDFLRQQETENNRLAKLNAILPELEKEGLSEEQLRDVAEQIMSTGELS